MTSDAQRIIEHLEVDHGFIKDRLDELLDILIEVACKELHRWDHEMGGESDDDD